MTIVQKVLAALAAFALVFALTLSKERGAQASYARVRAEEAAAASPAEIVQAFRDLGLAQRRPADAVAEYMAPTVVSHISDGQGGVLTVGAWLDGQRWGDPDGPQSELKRLAVDGELVVVHHHIRGERGQGRAAVTIFRIEGPRVAEVWEVEAAIPAAVTDPAQLF